MRFAQYDFVNEQVVQDENVDKTEVTGVDNMDACRSAMEEVATFPPYMIKELYNMAANLSLDMESETPDDTEDDQEVEDLEMLEYGDGHEGTITDEDLDKPLEDEYVGDKMVLNMLLKNSLKEDDLSQDQIKTVLDSFEGKLADRYINYKSSLRRRRMYWRRRCIAGL